LVMVLQLRGFDSRPLNQNTITDAAATSGRMVASSISSGANHVWREQSETVYRLVLQEAQFHPTVVAAEVDWFYNQLGLDDFYFRTMSPAVIARHVLAFIAAKLHGNATGTAADIEFISEEENNALYICPVDRIVEVQRKIESKYLNEGYEGSGRRRTNAGPSVKFFVSRGTAAANNKTKLALFIVRFYDWLEEKCSENETDIWKLASGVFLREKAFGSRMRYATIIEQASRALGPIISVSAPQKSGEEAVMTVAYKTGSTHSFSSSMTQLLQRAGITIGRSYVETFANGVIVHSIHCSGRPHTDMKDIIEQASLLWTLPRTSLTPLVETQKLTLPEACYAYAGWKFAFHFASTKSEEFNHLWKALSGDADARSDLLRLKKRIRTDVATEQRIADTIFEQVEVIKELFRDFSRFHTPGSTEKPVFNAELWSRLQKQILNTVDLEVFRCFLVFNANLLKTNFFYRSKTALAFRFNPSFLADEYPIVPYGLFMILSAEARGFHVRFDDVARGGIRLIRSRNKQLWQRNAETVFDENYNLAWTQQKKNKDIPEGGSKGTILLNVDHQEKAIVAFHKYIDAMLDCLLPTAEMRDHHGKSELVFCGPDEGTADVMDWAALYAKKRGYGYWSAFTTGKSVELGGIPHDMYGMTTRGVHQYVLGVLRKLGLDESQMRKGQVRRTASPLTACNLLTAIFLMQILDRWPRW
jgi:glutamate dehydrogenase